jgi:hypothetical protein
MNDPINGLLAVAIAMFIFAVAATLFIGHKRRRIAEQMEAEREAERRAAPHAS